MEGETEVVEPNPGTASSATLQSVEDPIAMAAGEVSDGVRWLDVGEQTAWRAFLSMYARLNAQLNREMQEHSRLSIADFSVLVQLSEHVDGRMRVLELARGLEWEKSRLSHQLTRMQARGLVDRSFCSEDRRGAFVALTTEGRAAVERAAPRHVESVRAYMFDELTPDQVDSLTATSRAVLARLESTCSARTAACTEADPTGI